MGGGGGDIGFKNFQEIAETAKVAGIVELGIVEKNEGIISPPALWPKKSAVKICGNGQLCSGKLL